MAAGKVDYARMAFDLVDDFDRLTSVNEVMDRLSGVLNEFGYTSFLITGVPEPPMRLEPYILLNGWSAEWASHYTASGYYKDDPVAAYCRRCISPFDWSEAPYCGEQNPRAAEIMQTAAEEFGLKKGFLVPILRSSGFHACVTMAGESPDYESDAKRAIHMLSLFAHARVTLLLDGARDTDVYESLTEREKEVLTWIAAGKSSWDIAHILNITERTVNWTIGRAMRKLDAVNRTQAVVNAIRTGAIQV